MTVAALIGLEERERIDAIRERGRQVDFAELLRSAFWGKEGLKFDRESWEQSLAHVPDSGAEIAEPGKLTSSERSIVQQILAGFAKPKSAEVC
jgi:hypothetical protein